MAESSGEAAHSSSRGKRTPFVIGILTLLALGALLMIFLTHYEADALSGARSRIGDLLGRHCDALSRALDRRILLLEGLRAFVESDLEGAASNLEGEFAPFAAGLRREFEEIRCLTVSPGGVVALVYPREGNERHIGQSFFANRREGVKTALEGILATRKIAMIGPYPLVPGGEPTIEAMAAIQGRDGFWGIVSSAIEVGPLLKASGFDALSRQLVVAIRNLKGEVFWGDPSAFQGNPVIRHIELFGQVLAVGAYPAGGWRTFALPGSAGIHAAGILGIFFAAGIAYLLAGRHSDLLRTIRLRTDELELTAQRFHESEKKRAEEALRASEERLRLALLGANDGLWDWDFSADHVYYSPRWKSMLGYSEDELEAHLDTWKNLVHPQDRERTLVAVGDLVAQRTDKFEVEFRMMHKDGSLRDILSRGFLVRGPEGEAVRMVGTHVDITQRKKTEEMLSDREAKLRSILSAASVGIGLAVDRVFQEVNDSLCRITGYSREQLIGKDSRMFYVTEPDYELVGRERASQIAECGMAIIETQWRAKDGAVREVVVNSSPVDIADPAKGHIFTVLDITERKQAERALRESEYFLRRSQEVAHAGSFYLDTRTGDWISSPTMDEVLGIDSRYPRSLKEWLNIIHPADKREIMRHWKKLVLGRQKTFDREFRILRQDDAQQRWVHGIGELQFDEKGRLAKMLGTVQDITERRRAEEALRTSEALLDKAQQITHLGSWEMGLEEQTLNCSDEIFRIFGVSPRAFQPDLPDFFERVYPEDREMVLQHYHETVTTGEFRSYEYRIVRPDGTVRWVHSTGEADFNKKGVPVQVLGTLQDITDRKREQEEKQKLESQLIQAQKMESIGRLAGGVAHDFNNMLSVILGYTELIKARMALDGVSSSYVEEVEKAAKRSRDITRQLLAFSRKQIIAPQTIDLNDHINETRKTLSRMIGEDLHLHFQPGEDLWTVKLDPFQLDQILMNLAVNARDAMLDGGTLMIKTANFRVDAPHLQKHYYLSPGDFVLLEITDEGTGMDENTLSHVFEPFFTTKELGRGTGLGLATVYGIVKQNNGFINVYSESGQGTCFRIYFPRSNGEESAPVPEEARGLENPGTVLLVEDSEPVRELIAQLLDQIGCTVLAAQTPEEALVLCAEPDISVDILLTDVVMPNMNGAELGERVAAMRPRIKILFMSGYPEDFIAHRGVLNQGVHFIQKPFSINDIADKIGQITREKPAE